MIALLVSLAVVALLFAAFWSTLSDRTRDELEPTAAEHAAADAGRSGGLHHIGTVDAVVAGDPAILDAKELEASQRGL